MIKIYSLINLEPSELAASLEDLKARIQAKTPVSPLPTLTSTLRPHR